MLVSGCVLDRLRWPPLSSTVTYTRKFTFQYLCENNVIIFFYQFTQSTSSHVTFFCYTQHSVDFLEFLAPGCWQAAQLRQWTTGLGSDWPSGQGHWADERWIGRPGDWPVDRSTAIGYQHSYISACVTSSVHLACHWWNITLPAVWNQYLKVLIPQKKNCSKMPNIVTCRVVTTCR